MKIAVLGCGAYGLALATQFCKKENEVVVYTPFQEEKDEILKTGMREKVLPSVSLSSIVVTLSLKEALFQANFVVFAVPFPAFESTLLNARSYLSQESILVLASKGLSEEGETGGMLLKKHQVANPFVVLSGPTFAEDLAKGEDTILTLASQSEKALSLFKTIFPKQIQLEFTSDVEGVSYCGALKNVFAILEGYIASSGVSNSTQAFFLYKGLMQIGKFLEQMGCSSKTLFTSAGIADFYMSCENVQSRNYTFGSYLATKDRAFLATYLKENTTEGVATLQAVSHLCKKRDVQFPIFQLLEETLAGKSCDIQDFVDAILC